MRHLLILVAFFSAAPLGRGQGNTTGINDQTRRSINRGLKWLAEQQREDGSVPFGKDFMPIEGSAFAGLAFLASADHAGLCERRKNILSCVKYLLDHLDTAAIKEDNLTKNGPDPSVINLHGHAYALTFLAVAWENRGTFLDADSRKALEEKWAGVIKSAIKRTVTAQAKNGGWYYEPNADSDEGTVAAAQMIALQECRRAGFEVDPEVLRRARDYMDGLTDGSGCTRYASSSEKGKTTLALTAGGVLGLGAAEAEPKSKADRGLDVVLDNLRKRRTGDADPYPYYSRALAALALSQSGGERWAKGWIILRDELLKEQGKDGSWSWREDKGNGPVFATSLALLVLQSPRRSLGPYLGEAELAVSRFWRIADSPGSLTVEFSGESGSGESKSEIRGMFQFKTGNRAMVALTMTQRGQPAEFKFKSDGKRFVMWNDGKWTQPDPLIDGLVDFLRGMGTRTGFTNAVSFLPFVQKYVDRTKSFPALEEYVFLTAFTRRKGEGEGFWIVEYDTRLDKPDASLHHKVWLDKSGIPTKRVTSRKDEAEKERTTVETYEKTSTNEIPDDVFTIKD